MLNNDCVTKESLFWLRTVPYLTELQKNKTQVENELEELSESSSFLQILIWILLALTILFFVAAAVLALILWRKRYNLINMEYE